MNAVTSLPWRSTLACSAVAGLFACWAVVVFKPQPAALAGLALWAGPHLGPFAALVFAHALFIPLLLGTFLAALVALPLWVSYLWSRIVAVAALLCWFAYGMAYTYSGV